MTEILSKGEKHYARLESRAASPQAQQFVARLEIEILKLLRGNGSLKKKQPAQALAEFRNALERFAGDLLVAKVTPGLSGVIYRSLAAEEYRAGQPIPSIRALKHVIEGLTGLKLIKKVPQPPKTPGTRGPAAHFIAEPKMVTWATQARITKPDILQTHFRQELPRATLVLRKKTEHDEDGQRVTMSLPFESTAKTEAIAQDVRDLNKFLSNVRIEGAQHHAFVRIFNEADNDTTAYQWDRGGRLYSQVFSGDSYQQLSEPKRANIRFDGEPTAEIDIRASYLTLLHAKAREAFDVSRDPYDGLGFKRDHVKLWTIFSLGQGKLRTTWPKKHRDQDEKTNDVAKAVKAKMLKAFPALRRLGSPGFGWGSLMFLESEIIVGTMRELMRRNVPSLPIHDSLVVPLAKAEEAATVLIHQFAKFTETIPYVTIDVDLALQEKINAGGTEELRDLKEHLEKHKTIEL